MADGTGHFRYGFHSCPWGKILFMADDDPRPILNYWGPDRPERQKLNWRTAFDVFISVTAFGLILMFITVMLHSL